MTRIHELSYGVKKALFTMNGTRISLLRATLLILSVFSLRFSLYGQLCTGSLGDPVVNITFGTGPGDAGSYSAPGYTYTASTCPNDGSYTITNYTSGCFGNAWYTVSNDHTGGGNFMLVNASYQPADFFVATLNNLCPSTTYEFSAWMMNVLNYPQGIKPNLTYTIETPGGVVLHTYNTGDIGIESGPQWKQYGFYFTTTTGNSTIVLRIRNNAPGGNGNDLALDDITFRPCGPQLSSSILGNSNIINICTYDQVGYTLNGAVSPGFVSPVFQWQNSVDSGRNWVDIPGATSLSYLRQATNTGNFWYRLTVAEAGNSSLPFCRIASNVLEINVRPKPFVEAGPGRILVSGGSVTLNGFVSGENPTYGWSPPDGLSDPRVLQPQASPSGDTYYRLQAVSAFGCVADDIALVRVVKGIFVPTAFTPNNDGKNDYWRIPYLDPMLNARVTVYNRWGQLVYAAEGLAVNWDGKRDGLEQPAGMYVWVMEFKDGTPMQKGTVMLIR